MTLKQLLLLAALLAACGSKPMGGTAELRFAASSSVVNSPNLKSPLKGTFYGNIFLQEDVQVTGPRADAMEFQFVQQPDIDLTMKGAGEPSDTAFTTMTLPAGIYVVLGFFDVNGNGATSKMPDSGDPVTLATTNSFTIVDGQVAKRLVLMELVFN